MTKLVLNAEKRNLAEKTKVLRVNRIIPGVVYGRTQESISIQMDASELLRTFRISGESSIVNLKIKGLKEEIEVLFHDSQFEPVSGDFTHVDFYALTRGQKLTTKIHLNFIGNSEAIKEGAVLSENVKEIEVSCLPKDLIKEFDVDLSLLKKEEDVIRLSDLNIDTSKYDIHNLHADDAIAVANKAKVEVISDEAPEDNIPEEESKEKETK
ncbi:MAG: 50S ribosomal protein L25 [Candidatus Gracilibacteria bacterium]|nr:50S ribosomal protein L25 [Candidatus Gracilibacteria bacterium]